MLFRSQGCHLCRVVHISPSIICGGLGSPVRDSFEISLPANPPKKPKKNKTTTTTTHTHKHTSIFLSLRYLHLHLHVCASHKWVTMGDANAKLQHFEISTYRSKTLEPWAGLHDMTTSQPIHRQGGRKSASLVQLSPDAPGADPGS